MKSKPKIIILAAGKSARMGVDKGLLKYNHTFWILEQFNRISKTEIEEVTLVLGYHFNNYFIAIPWLKSAVKEPYIYQNIRVKVVINKDPEKGMFSSFLTALKSQKLLSDFLVLPIDVPFLNPFELNKIIQKKNTVVIPVYKQQKGHPIKLSSSFCKSLLLIDENDKYARLDIQINQLNDSEKTIVNVNDSSIILNLNSPSSWKKFLKQ